MGRISRRPWVKAQRDLFDDKVFETCQNCPPPLPLRYYITPLSAIYLLCPSPRLLIL